MIIYTYDEIGILDSNLNQVVSYEYDSWGNTISIKDANGNNITSSSNIGIINPYRYRSYRYDTEIGLYYLNSRYYNPEWGRFINADGTTKDDNAGLMGHNMYLYCANNPINNVDPIGKSILIGVVIGITALIFIGATITQAIINGNQLNNAEEMFIAGITSSRPSSSTLNNLANKAKNSPAIKNEVKKAITYSKGKNFNNYESNEVVFSGGDLGLAIGKVTKTTILGIRN